jgi:hypothetical protein
MLRAAPREEEYDVYEKSKRNASSPRTPKEFAQGTVPSKENSEQK